MSDPKPAGDVKLFMSIFSPEGRFINEALVKLSEKYGPADLVSALIPFGHTDYYTRELGSTLIRRFVAFETLVRPESLPDIKILTNSIEKAFSVEGRRQINIDPGYVSLGHLILATGKGYSHRPYLRDGIYADLTLIYRNGAFETLPWTYPDYGEEKTRNLVKKIREKYLLQTKVGAC